ncbi:MAG: hypothetical protein ACU83P_10755 [Gammaproteobacteria bacterium]
MTREDPAELSGWIRFMWLPYIHYVLEQQHKAFFAAAADSSFRHNPADEENRSHMAMALSELTKSRGGE